MTEEDSAGSEGFDETDVVSLGKKLASLELTDGERAALAMFISDRDVEGFGRHGRFDLLGGIRAGFRSVRVPGGRAGGIRAEPDWTAAKPRNIDPGKF